MSKIMKWTLFTLLFFLLSCSKKQTPQEKRYPVRVDKTIKSDVPYYLRAVGELKASIAVEIRAQVSGILTNVLFKDGQAVNEGELLMTIDQRPFQVDLCSALATLEEDKAKLRYALEFAETYGALVGKEYVARLDYEQGIQNVDVYKALVQADEAAVEKAKINLAYTEIRAPTKGYMGLRTYDPGNYVNAIQNQVLVTLMKVTPITISFSVPSEYLFEIRERQKESPIYLEAFLNNDSKPLKGFLFFIDNIVNEQTGMLHLQGTVANEDERGWPGQFARVNLLLKTISNATLVPTEAIVLGQEGYFVFVVQEDKSVELRPIEKGIEYEQYTVISSGLSHDEVVVIDGQLNLYPGAKVFLPNAEKKEGKE